MSAGLARRGKHLCVVSIPKGAIMSSLLSIPSVTHIRFQFQKVRL